MSASIVFNKALYLLDKGDPRAEAELLRAISLADTEHDEFTLVGSLCAFGDFLCSLSRFEEALPFLERVIIAAENREDMFGFELKRAKDLLALHKKI